MALSQPNTTLYINNLNDKVNTEELRSQLYALFTTYGKVIDVVASKSSKMRGQAFLVFTDLTAATTAMRACEGMMFYDKPMVRCIPLQSHALRSHDPSSASAMQSQSHTRHPEERIQTFSPQLPRMHDQKPQSPLL
jgi:hypothetical protein